MTGTEITKNWSLGEVREEEIRAADLLARLLLESNQPRQVVILRITKNKELRGLSFPGGIIVTDEFIATSSHKGTLAKFLPRTLNS